MPELAEVALSADLIKPLVKEQIIINAFNTPNSRYANNPSVGLVEFNKSLPLQVIDVQTRGKFMYWTFDNDWYLLCTFGMTGQWNSKRGKHPCLVMSLQNDKEIIFNDPRHFGTIKFTNNKQDLTGKLNDLGWDALKDGMNEKWINFIINTCQKSKKPIGQLLMDQSIFAGCGNYLRAECLYESKISPWRIGESLSKDEITNICQSLIDVVKISYEHQGATISTYKTPYGDEGKYSSLFKVYGQKADPLGNSIIKQTTPEGRTMHWCPTIQK